jgi:hypothetical protein
MWEQWIRSFIATGLALAAIFSMVGCSQFEQRDKRFYYRALWNFALRDDLKELDIDFNGIDYGHSNVYENLLLTGARDVAEIENRARHETLRFIRSVPAFPRTKRRLRQPT